MELFLEIVKVTVPALVVFFTVWFLMKENRKKEESIAYIRMQERASMKEVNQSKVNAYERLALLCERIKIDKLIIRLRSENSGVENLRSAMMVAIQQEYDHNITQQVYVSHELWEIITLAKDETITMIQDAAKETSRDSIDEYIDNLFKEMQERGVDPLDKALYAIREETQDVIQ